MENNNWAIEKMENKLLAIKFRKIKHLERLSKYNHNLFEVETNTNCKFILEEFTDEQEKNSNLFY